MDIAVIGLGKIGLPLATQYAMKGHRVIGVDINPSVVELVNQGLEPFPCEADLASYLAETVASGSLSATGNYSVAIPAADVVVVVVPLFITQYGDPDFGLMDRATQSIGEHLLPNTLVMYETTLPVGTSRTRWAPMLEKISGLEEGSDFHVAFSPERVLTGQVFEDLRKYPKIVGGLSEVGEARAVEFYESVLDFDDRDDLPKPNGVWAMGSAEIAEMVKLAETTYRDVNIGLANQFARYADRIGIDVYKVIEASNSQPYSHIHQPGVAVGGHCIPVYPRLYLWNDPDASIVTAGREANLQMPEYAVKLLKSRIGELDGLEVLVLGVAYRGGVKETAFSGVFDIVNHLSSNGAEVFVDDPLYTDEEISALGLNTTSAWGNIQAIILQANHSEYHKISSADFPQLQLVLDGRKWLSRANWGDKLVWLGSSESTVA